MTGKPALAKAATIIGILSVTCAAFLVTAAITSSVYGTWWPWVALFCLVGAYVVPVFCAIPDNDFEFNSSRAQTGADCGWAVWAAFHISAFIVLPFAAQLTWIDPKSMYIFSPALVCGSGCLLAIWKLFYTEHEPSMF